MHPNYDNSMKVNDIALIRLKRNITFHKIRGIRSVCLPVTDGHSLEKALGMTPGDTNLTISGWGRTEFNDEGSDVLMTANVVYLPHQGCADKFAELRKKHSLIRINIEASHLVREVFVKPRK